MAAQIVSHQNSHQNSTHQTLKYSISSNVLLAGSVSVIVSLLTQRHYHVTGHQE